MRKGVDTWVGGNDIGSEGTFVWEDGSAWSYTNWDSGEPSNDGGTEHCVELRQANPNGAWNDADCSVSKHYICEVIL